MAPPVINGRRNGILSKSITYLTIYKKDREGYIQRHNGSSNISKHDIAELIAGGSSYYEPVDIRSPFPEYNIPEQGYVDGKGMRLIINNLVSIEHQECGTGFWYQAYVSLDKVIKGGHLSEIYDFIFDRYDIQELKHIISEKDIEKQPNEVFRLPVLGGFNKISYYLIILHQDIERKKIEDKDKIIAKLASDLRKANATIAELQANMQRINERFGF